MEPRPTRYVDVGGAQVAFSVIGDGPLDLVFHHGHCHVDLLWDGPTEAAFVRSLAEFSRVILFDRRGAGASDPPADGTFPTWEEWSRDLLAVLDAAGSERAALFAEQEAGPMALMLAAARPDRISHLILGNTYARASEAPDYPIGMSEERVDFWLELIESTWGDPAVLPAILPSLVGREADEKALTRIMRSGATPHRAAQQFRHVFRELDARQATSLIDVPTLVLQNQYGRDGNGNFDRSRWLADHIGGAIWRELPGPDAYLFGSPDSGAVEAVAEFLIGHKPSRRAERFLTTVLFTDIVDSTAQARSVGDERWRIVLDEHDRLVRTVLDQHGGREIKTTGDGFLACFDGPARAIDAATTIVDGVHGLDLRVRAGLHTGECERRGADIAGLAVHIAARVGATAGADEVLVSRTVTDLVAGSGIAFDDRGEHDLKGLDQSWHLFAVTGS